MRTPLLLTLTSFTRSPLCVTALMNSEDITMMFEFLVWAIVILGLFAIMCPLADSDLVGKILAFFDNDGDLLEWNNSEKYDRYRE